MKKYITNIILILTAAFAVYITAWAMNAKAEEKAEIQFINMMILKRQSAWKELDAEQKQMELKCETQVNDLIGEKMELQKEADGFRSVLMLFTQSENL